MNVSIEELEIEEELDIEEGLDIDLQKLQKEIEDVINDPIYYFPIRHHSPISALQVLQALEKQKPKLVFLEIPANYQELAEYLVDPQTRPPVAFYSAYKDEENILQQNGILSSSPEVAVNYQSWMPFVNYSPELQVLKYAKKKGIEVVFFDLPYIDQIEATLDLKKQSIRKTRDKDILWAENAFIKNFIEKAGFDSFNEAWDSIFEIKGLKQDHRKFREELLYFAAGVRKTIPDVRLEEDMTLIRESFMKKKMEKVLHEKQLSKSDVMVICGALHAVVLPSTTPRTVKQRKTDKSNMISTIVPFSYKEISEFSGYGAGNRAPLYYNRVWRKMREEPNQAYTKVALTLIARIISKFRKQGEILSTADSIAAFTTTRLLSKLRKREQPILEDIHDGFLTVYAKENEEIESKQLMQILQRLVMGNRIGKVTEKIGRFPLAIDFYRKLDKYSLPKEGTQQTIELSLKKKKKTRELKISQFLHKTVFLEIPYARNLRTQQLDGVASVFSELWKLRWNMKVDVELIKKSIYGTTIDSAVKAVLIEAIQNANNDPQKISKYLFSILKMGLYNEFDEVIDSLLATIDECTDFISLANTFNYLNMVHQYIMIRHTSMKSKRFDFLIDHCFKRICFNIPSIAGEETSRIEEIIDLMYSLVDNVLVCPVELDYELLIQMTQATIIQTEEHIVKGALSGILFKVKAISNKELIRQIKGYIISTQEERMKIGDFLLGLLKIVKNLALDNLIFETLNEVIMTPTPEEFLEILPGLKKSFADMPKKEKKMLIAKIKQMKEGKRQNKLMTKKFNVDKAFIALIESKVYKKMGEWNI
ncbi:MAG: DUF5682 family protein [Candidatus Hodarchaeales archaeon]